MKKEAVIHLHGLLEEVSSYYEGRDDINIDLGNYRSHEVKPWSIHKSQTEHKEALLTLADSLTEPSMLLII